MALAPLIVTQEVNRGAEAIRDHATDKMNAPKSGKMYYVKNMATGTYQWHRASAPGEAPAVLSGNLSMGVTIEPIPDGKAVAWWEDYADVLEFGKGRIAPRPFARPAAVQIFPMMVNKIKSRLGSMV